MPEIVASAMILLLIIAAYWSLAVLPRQQAFKKHQRYIRQLRVGDEVVTYGGLIGTLTQLEPDKGEAVIRLAENVEVRIITAAITQPYNPQELAHNAQIAAPREVHQNEV